MDIVGRKGGVETTLRRKSEIGKPEIYLGSEV